MMRATWKRAAAFLIPAVVLVCAAGMGGSQQQVPDGLFDPLYDVYRYVQSYFYKPEQVTDQGALYGAMKGIVEQLDDPYSEFLDPQDLAEFNESLEGEFSGVGIEISIEDGILTVITPLVGTPAEAAGLVPGDQILAIDGESTEGITLSKAGTRIRGETGTTVVLTLRRENGSILDVPIVRATITIAPVEWDVLEDISIGYIRILRFESDTVAQVDEAIDGLDRFADLDGVILDLRNNPGGLMAAAISLCSRFVDQGIVLRTLDRATGEKMYWSKGNVLPNLPLAVLINRGTASASEITAGAIRDNEMGILIGSTSYGKGVFQQVIDFPDGSALKITAGEYFTPSGRSVHEVGLPPDLVVEEDEDPIDVAVSWIREHVGQEMPIDLGPVPTP
ncbi:MAG: S41 family peptidase [Candidatus Bipolaricaulota bacterium]